MWRWVVAGLVLAVAVTQGLARRPDPAAEPGLRIAVVLLIEADATLGGTSSDTNGAAVPPDAEQRAQRAAVIARIWADDAGQRRRLDAVQDLPVVSDQVRFVVERWVEVAAWADHGRVVVAGHLERRPPDTGVWRSDPSQTLRIDLTRGDPVGAQRGWRLASVRSQSA